MEKDIDYKKLYVLQDEILSVVFSLDNSFYLTGGTALHRFYYDYRYSDDLDFFANGDSIFGESVHEIMAVLIEKGYEVKHTVQAKDFHRVMIDDFLQLDFVNDRVHREGKSNVIDTMRIDNKVNILANKITAIVGRDEEKDFFDLFVLAKNESFNWQKILEIASKKSIFEKDILIYRLESFPLTWLNNIKLIKPMAISKDMVMQLTNDILLEQNNTLKKEN